MTLSNPGALPLTGERTVPGIPAENYWFRRHEAAYEFALAHVGGRVLEVGCGEGYGTALLAGAGRARSSASTTTRSRSRTRRRRYPQARFVRANLAALPVRAGVGRRGRDAAGDRARVEPPGVRRASAGGCCGRAALLLVTTPNRLTFSPGSDVPVNPFHTKEFTAAELAELLTRCGFAVDDVLGLHAGPRLRRPRRAARRVVRRRPARDAAGRVERGATGRRRLGRRSTTSRSSARRRARSTSRSISSSSPAAPTEPSIRPDRPRSAGTAGAARRASSAGRSTRAIEARTSHSPDRSAAASSASSTNTGGKPAQVMCTRPVTGATNAGDLVDRLAARALRRDVSGPAAPPAGGDRAAEHGRVEAELSPRSITPPGIDT